MRENSKIPFVKPSRIGNFKMWRSKCQVSVYPDLSDEERKRVVVQKGKVRPEKFDVECINVSNLEGTWKVQIPATFEMFSVLNMLYSDFIGDDRSLSERAMSIFACLLGNMMYASTIGNGYYHRALEIVATCYAHPDILDEGSESNEDLLKDARGLVSAFLDWRTAYDANVRASEPTDEEAKREDIAEQAEKIMEDGDKGSTERQDEG